MSNNEKTFTHYRIGDFAKYLGVTSDFLKHYEEAGLIDVVQRASGYRYYPFNQAARVIEYMRLRNYGVTVKEMNGVLTGNSGALSHSSMSARAIYGSPCGASMVSWRRMKN